MPEEYKIYENVKKNISIDILNELVTLYIKKVQNKIHCNKDL